MGAPGGSHCADVSEGRSQGTTAASAAGDAARALRATILQSGDGGLAPRGRERPTPFRGESGEDAGRDDDPDFRRRLECRGLAHLPFGRSGITWPRGGILLKKGSIVDTAIISAPLSTGNESNARGPEMHRTRKGNRRHFGMKPHICTDPRGLVHHLEGTAANVYDLTPSGWLLHGEEEQVWGDAGYRGIGRRAEHAHREVLWQIAMNPGKRRVARRPRRRRRRLRCGRGWSIRSGS